MAGCTLNDVQNYPFDTSNFPLCENTCRTCLKSLKRYKNSVFKQDVTEKISSLTSLKMFKEDGLPKFICNACFEKLNSAVEYKKQAETAHEVLKKYLNDSITQNNVNEETALEIDELKTHLSDSSVNDETAREDDNFERVSRRISRVKKQKTSDCLKEEIVHRKFGCDKCGKQYSNQYDLKVITLEP
ncbi:hypothetical protein NQ315_012641 [Exocentrus adspersus]|uniref:ZAD domain-containing protein n=1 Tax=Exocentrus adspersus TaxID=1586481 RepID=A0AAV8VSQ0_9CUCU|nr:hypothetical protein NQ315_012641 [Exocentrus adspersus]